MSDQSLRFRLPGAAWSLEIPTDGLAVLKSHVQRGWLKREVVGQLFARDLTAEVVVVEVVTKLPAQWSAFTGVGFDLQAAGTAFRARSSLSWVLAYAPRTNSSPVWN